MNNGVSQLKGLLILILLTAIHLKYFAQNSNAKSRVLVSCKSKTLNVNDYEIMEIRQTFRSGGMDSIVITVRPDSLYKVGDTLFVKPLTVEKQNYMDVNQSVMSSDQFDVRSNFILKIPIRNVDFIKLKKQPIGAVFATLTTASYLTFFSSLFVAAGSEKYADQALTAMAISLPATIISWSLHAAIAKKRIHLGPDSHRKKVWKFL